MTLTLHERLTLWARLLVLQATWSYRRMQTCGWLWVAEPIARRGGDAAALLRRAVVQFNTHALLAPLLLGAAIDALGRDDSEGAKAVLVRWMGTFGALGDMWYWQTLAWHFTWLSGLAWLLAGGPGVLALACIWTGGEILLRIFWFERGLRSPQAIAQAVKRLTSPRLRARLSSAAVLCLAPVAGAGFAAARDTAGTAADADIVTAIAAGLAVTVATRTRFRSVVLWLPFLVGLTYGLWTLAFAGSD